MKNHSRHLLCLAAVAGLANPGRGVRRPQNAPGPLFVDETCIDCDTCRWMSPETYASSGGKSAVAAQPSSRAELAGALRAVVACPTGSIRIDRDGAPFAGADVAAARDAFPTPVDAARLPHVAHLGFHSPKSFGATPYLVRRRDRKRRKWLNVMVDSPRFDSRLADRIDDLGGVRWILLTHMDDVADHELWAERFPAAERVMHAADVRGADAWPHVEMRAVERQLDGEGPWALARGVTAVHTPGHSRGSLCFLVDGRETGGESALFTGDHLAWVERLGRLDGFARYGWDVGVQADSIRKLAELDFDWVLPGHGRRARFESADDRRRALALCADELAAGAGAR